MIYTDEQYNIAHDRSNRLLVSSLAGTGKTETVSLRILKLLEEGKSVLCLCFTNAAVSQLSDRLKNKGLGSVKVMTIDAFTSRIASHLDYKTTDGTDIVKQVLQRNGIVVNNSECKIFQKMAAFNYFNKGVDTPLFSIRPDFLEELINQYDIEKRKRNVLDFSDACIVAAKFLSFNKSSYDEVIVDEAQDVNELQIKLLNKLAGGNALTFVGDSNQSIFSFAGVSPYTFNTMCSDWNKLYLSESFRSGKKIIDSTNVMLKELESDSLLSSNINESDVGVSEGRDETVEWLHNIDSGSTAILGATRYDLIKLANAVESSGNFVWRSWMNDKSDIHKYKYVFSTIHKSKGLEFDNVVVASIPEFGFSGEDNKRLMYVALSRARKNLLLEKSGTFLPYNLEGSLT